MGAPASVPGGSGLVPTTTTTLSLSESLPLLVLLLVTTRIVAYMWIQQENWSGCKKSVEKMSNKLFSKNGPDEK